MYRILIDSCGELTDEMKAGGHFVSIPLTLQVDGYEIVDDETFDQADFLARVAASPTGAKSACPSPDLYMQAMDGPYDHVYAVTLSAQLSGSYNSAVLAQELLAEQKGADAPKVHVFDSKSASIGQTLIGMKIAECEEAGMTFEEVISTVDAYIESQHTFFVLESLDALRKNGRLSGLKAAIVTALNIKPVMGSTEIGSIQQLGQGRGMSRALDKMISCMLEVTANCSERVVAISHCNCPERAASVVERLKKAADFKKIFVLDTRGVSSLYASDGGIIMVV